MIEVPGLRSTPSNRSHRLLTRVFPGSSLIVVLPVFRVVVGGILACGCDGLFANETPTPAAAIRSPRRAEQREPHTFARTSVVLQAIFWPTIAQRPALVYIHPAA